MIKIKRCYDAPSESDGLRVLVDRLWPRGISKQKARLSLWLREIAPSDALRKWFAHDPARWKAFQKRYAAELRGKKELISQLRVLAKEKKTLTLVYAARDAKHNNAVALKRILSR